MIKFFSSLARMFKLGFILSKYQILWSVARRYTCLPFYMRCFFIITNVLFYPLALISSNKEPLGKRLVDALQHMGPIYIKLGQTLSTRPDLIGVDTAKDLALLQDKLPPFDGDLAGEILEQSLGKKLDELFVSFNKTPVAAASIAQVHEAEIEGGKRVAVKILRPQIVSRYESDIVFLEYLAYIITKFLHRSSKLRLTKVIEVFKKTMQFELNLKFEAASASRIADNFAGDHMLKVPAIYWHYVRKNILVSEWVEGVSIYDHEALAKHKLNRKELAANIAHIFFNQAYRDGFFHADFHPGNILICADGRIAMVDFGIVGILPEQDRFAIAEILHAFLRKDYVRVAKIHRKVGYVPADTDLEYFAQSCRIVVEPIMGRAMKDISVGNLLAQLLKLAQEYGMEAQPQLVLLQKTMVMVEGVAGSLDPEVNMWNLMEPWMKKWGAKNISPEARLLRAAKQFIDKILY